MDRFQHSLPNILLRAVLALAVSAGILLALYAVVMDMRAPPRDDRPQAIDIPGKMMEPVVGSALVEGDKLVVTGYEGAGERTAVAVWRSRFEALDYPLLKYQVDAAFPGPDILLIWRTLSDPGVLYNTELAATDGRAARLDLARLPDWRGTVLEIGVYVRAHAAEQELAIGGLALEPLGWRAALATDWSEWTRFRGWSAQSINYLYGTPDSEGLSPVLVAAAWSALAVLLLLIAGLLRGGVPVGALAAVVLLPWISLDLLWQRELSTQLLQTRDQFAGKTIPEKHLADLDGDIYGYITRLKNEVLPAEPARIVILHDSHGHNFERLKAQYYLLPNNSYNRGRSLPREGLNKVDYVLALGTVPGLEFSAESHTLIWKNRKRTVRADLLDSDPMGTLYRLQSNPNGEDRKP
jgi:hypothetical protein